LKLQKNTDHHVSPLLQLMLLLPRSHRASLNVCTWVQWWRAIFISVPAGLPS